MATKKKAPKKGATAKKAPAKKAAPKKGATAKKAAVKKSTAKKAPVKKAAPKKGATAKKAAPKKGATAKKAAPKKGATAKKAAVKKSTAKKAPAKKAAPKKGAAVKKAPPKKKTKAPFKVRDKVVYPHHGAATIIKREKIEFAGEKQEYYVLQVATDQLTLRVPVENAIERGVRPVISKNKARQVFATFKDEPQEAGANWSRWYKLLTEKINSGDIFQVAEVVRDLTYAQQVKGISPALKRMLAKARLIIVSELQFSLALSEEKTIEKLDRALPQVEPPEDA